MCIRDSSCAVADTPLRLLAPARMIDLGIDVRVEPVLARVLLRPRRLRLLLDERDADDGLDTLEAVLPRHDEPDRRAVLVGQRLTVEPHRQDRERVHGFVEPQALDVWPGQRLEHTLLSRHLRGPLQGLEGDVLGAALRFDLLQQLREREPHPGNDHRPAFHAAHAIDALLERNALQDVFERVVRRLADETVDLHRPWARLEAPRVGHRVALVGAELVKIVVAHHVLLRRRLLVR